METKTIAYVRNTANAITGRIQIEDTIGDAPSSYMFPHDYFTPEEGMVVRPLNVSSNTLDPYYEVGGDRHVTALEYFQESLYEAGEVFTRYMRIFYPLVPVVHEHVTTGYSQGDNIELIAWYDEEFPENTPKYLVTADRHRSIENWFKFVGGFTRGQFINIIHHEAQITDMTIDEDQGVVTANIDWVEVGATYGVYYEEEFEPAKEALNYVRGMINIDEELEEL